MQARNTRILSSLRLTPSALPRSFMLRTSPSPLRPYTSAPSGTTVVNQRTTANSAFASKLREPKSQSFIIGLGMLAMSFVTVFISLHMVQLDIDAKKRVQEFEEFKEEAGKRIECLEARIRLLEKPTGSMGTPAAAKSAWFGGSK
ncbi:hypothetical protein HDU96_002937 [Phlyctochytrium bullatum]|nr:hypothetical protein HDU96_002937 [Phlyctochytrium bullatum]